MALEMYKDGGVDGRIEGHRAATDLQHDIYIHFR
jgi:hypothetical protein